MAYTLTPTTEAPVLRGDGSPLLEGASSITLSVLGVVDFAVLDGAIVLRGLAVGQVDVTITPNGGAPVAHAVTVEADPFDWSLGAPVAK